MAQVSAEAHWTSTACFGHETNHHVGSCAESSRMTCAQPPRSCGVTSRKLRRDNGFRNWLAEHLGRNSSTRRRRLPNTSRPPSPPATEPPQRRPQHDDGWNDPRATRTRVAGQHLGAQPRPSGLVDHDGNPIPLRRHHPHRPERGRRGRFRPLASAARRGTRGSRRASRACRERRGRRAQWRTGRTGWPQPARRPRRGGPVRRSRRGWGR